MRCMVRNKQEFYYALYIDKNELKDEYGNVTGEYEVLYGDPVKMKGNISSPVGETQVREFGGSENYDKVIVLDDKNAPINEHSILWVDSLPLLNENGTTNTPYDYTVKRVARSLNGVLIGIKKVDVNG